MSKKIITILTGAGIDQESGISTFRDSNGLWENYSVEDVASPKGWLVDPALVLKFYNERRRQLLDVEPNEAHKQLVRLEEKYTVNIITQNVSDLQERVGSTRVLHLHGQLTQSKSSGNENTVKEIGYEDINLGELCEEGFQMRPNIVWFGESVPMIITAEGLVFDANIFIVIGTSLNVYPAAGLIKHVHSKVPIYVIDPAELPLAKKDNITFIKEKAIVGVTKLVEKLLSEV